MSRNDPRLQTALDAATDRIRSALSTVAHQVGERCAALAQSSTRIADRDALNSAHFELRRHAPALLREFERALVERIAQDLAPAPPARRTLAGADWQSLSLVDDREVEERMAADRIGQQITQGAEEQLRELDAHIGALLARRGAETDRNPLRGEVLGTALQRGVAAVSKEAPIRALLTREIGAALAKAMPACYAAILEDLQRRGVRPLELSVRQVEGPGNQLPGLNSAYETLDSVRSQQGVGVDAGSSREFQPSGPADAGDPSGSRRASHPSASGPGYGTSRLASGPAGSGLARGVGRAEPVPTSRGGGGWRGDTRFGTSGRGTTTSDATRSGGRSSRADSDLMALLRQLNDAGEDVDAADFARPSGRPADDASGSGAFAARTVRESGRNTGPGRVSGHRESSLSGLMAVNLIRAHRDELMRAAGGHLDHMVIDLVGALFDQILSDARVPPQMARQVARLQLPVLRVALSDSSFFSSRRHPVRRFVNRIASLACAFDDFGEGPGRRFLDRVTALVDEIVDGDFDQIDLYAQKLEALEAYTEDEAGRDVQQRGTIATLGAKETELRLQQRYVRQLQAALQPLALPLYIEEFLSQVWSQALLLAALRDGRDAERTRRYRRAGRDLAMSVQPQGSPALRKRFLMQLPPLMKDLHEGLALVGWPAEAQRAFLERLKPDQASAVKAPARSELDHNLYAKQIENILAAPLPGEESLTAADPVPAVAPEALTPHFTPEEARRVGLVTENAVDWSETLGVDIDLDEPRVASGSADPTVAVAPEPASISIQGIDIDLGTPTPAHPADRPEPTRGAGLMDHVKLGFAYQMQLKDSWQKVRLAHVSAGRGFFVFTAGHRHQETISMTARMLARMCETHRFRAVENDYLVERATHRARKQLAALGGAAASGAISRTASRDP